MMIIGGLSINNKTSLKKSSCATSNFKFFSSSLKEEEDCIEVQEMKKKVVLCSHCPQNLKLGIFTS